MAQMKDHRNINAFLDMIAYAEGTLGFGDDGYNVMFGYSYFDDYSKHPNKLITLGKYKSTCAGRYQLLGRYYEHYKRELELPDFGKLSQDLIAIQQIKECRALTDIKLAKVESAIKKCARIWASFPGSPYGQPTKTMAEMLIKWKEFGGK